MSPKLNVILFAFLLTSFVFLDVEKNGVMAEAKKSKGHKGGSHGKSK
jgi:hypothetical protein